jgi:hypothetical protein
VLKLPAAPASCYLPLNAFVDPESALRLAELEQQKRVQRSPVMRHWCAAARGDPRMSGMRRGCSTARRPG